MGPTDKDALEIDQGEDWMQIRVRVQPRASREGIAGVLDGALQVRLNVPPIEGKANLALQALLAKRLGIPRACVEIVSGGHSRTKRVRLRGVSARAVQGLAPAPSREPSGAAHG
jgi:hypothetical protein